jgi:hypothetical protein
LYLIGAEMFCHSISVKILLSITVSMLLGGIVTTELPELLSLADNALNDFAIRKALNAERSSMLSAANYRPILSNLKDSESGAVIRGAAIFAKPKSSDLLVLHSVLRR